MTSLRDNIARVRENIDDSARRSGRDPAGITLVAVTKTVPARCVAEAVRAGLTVLGENRVQEAREKIAAAGVEAEWHLVGHLQSNKAREAQRLFRMIHSVDSAALARRLDQARERDGPAGPLDILIQVNVSGEASKSGIRPEEIGPALEEIAACTRVRVRGLMTIPPWSADPEAARPHFARLRGIAERAAALGIPAVEMKELSMGMTDDYAVAIEEGATMVRVGRALFGERP